MRVIILLFVLVSCDQHKPHHSCLHGNGRYMYQVTHRGLIRMQMDFVIEDERIRVYETSDGIITIQLLP